LYDDFAKASDDLLRNLIDKPELVDEWARLVKLGASPSVRKLVAEGVKIKNLRPGTNGKYVIIGRDMGSVKSVADKLKIHAGKDNVFALDDGCLNGMKFSWAIMI